MKGFHQDSRRFLLPIGISLALVVAALRVGIAYRFGFLFVDEAARAGLVQSILDGAFPIPGVPYFGILFVQTDSSFTPFTFTVPAVLWSRLFGSSAASLRVFVALATIAGIVLLGRSVSYWFRNNVAVWVLTVLVALLLPWNFMQGLQFWNPTLVPVFIIVAFWAFSFLANHSAQVKSFDRPDEFVPSRMGFGVNDWRKNALARWKLLAITLFPLALVAATYTYQPAAFMSVALFVLGVWLLNKWNSVRPAETLSFFIIAACASIPFIVAFFAWPYFLERTDFAIWAAPTFLDGIRGLFLNLDSLFSLSNLFLYGDSNGRHTSGAMGGMLGFGALIPMIALFGHWRRLDAEERFLANFSVFGIFFAMLGSALTLEGNPHSLRSNGAWVFFTVLIVLGYMKIYQMRGTLLGKLILLLAAVSFLFYSVYYIHHFVTEFTQIRHIMFDFIWHPGEFPYIDYWKTR